MTPVHPQSMQELRRLVKLHGAGRIVAAVRAIEREPVDIVDRLPRQRPPQEWHDWLNPKKDNPK